MSDSWTIHMYTLMSVVTSYTGLESRYSCELVLTVEASHRYQEAFNQIVTATVPSLP
jgi:hypothetical protein